MFNAKEAHKTATAVVTQKYQHVFDNIKTAAKMGYFSTKICVTHGTKEVQKELQDAGYEVSRFISWSHREGTDYTATVSWASNN